jgi:hypothetical protein
MVRKQKADESSVATLDPPVVPSYGEIIRKRIRGDVSAYREIVTRAAAGEQLSEAEILSAYETLQRLGFPPGQLEQDLAAVREHTKNKTRWSEHVAREPEERARLLEVEKELEQLKQRTNELRAQAHRLSFGSSMKAAGALQRCNELTVTYAHVLSDLEQAVEARARALRVDAAATAGVVA